jgi:hypothetical protein
MNTVSLEYEARFLSFDVEIKNVLNFVFVSPICLLVGYPASKN